MYANAVFGIWPFIFEDYPFLKKIYDLYYKFCLVYFLSFVLGGWIQLYLLLTHRPLNITEIMLNITLTFLYSVTFARAWQIKNPRMKKIIKNIMDWEKTILDSKDEKLINIIKNYAWQNKIVSQVYTVNVIAVATLFVVNPLGLDPIKKYNPVTNATITIKPLPISSWLPFDDQKHYLSAYLINSVDCWVGAAFISITDILSFGLITFPLGQIVILNHILTNFDVYVSKVQNGLVVDRNEASFLTLRDCILKHKDIINYIEVFNEEMNIIALMDFVLSSLELAAKLLELMLVELSILNAMYTLVAAIGILARLFGNYWYANEIIIQSSKIPDSIWDSKWYKEPKKTQQMMLIMMLRCSRPLTIEIGPFTTMSLNTYIGILKTTYSYNTLVYGRAQD